ncbi:MAG: DNA polymerase III subunit delta [Clostridia bacterium]|nr:DNA polymerase III subunit delta [Clostridia bacterium]
MTETQLKDCIKTGTCPLYLLYGEESYLTEQYAKKIADATVEPGMDAFNLQKFDGQALTFNQLEEAVEALPLMADRKCVLVRDMDIAGPEADRLLELISHLPDSCVLVFWQMTVQPNRSKNAWKAFMAKAEEVGAVVNFEKKTPADAAKLLVAGAKRRGCIFDPRDALYLVEQAGNDLNLLLHELDKLCALATDGVITRQSIDAAAVKNLETKVYDLSKAILRRDTATALTMLHQLAVAREEPVSILAVLSGAYADLYRAKVATTAGLPVEKLSADFKVYKGKEWRLRNAARDVSRLSMAVLRDSLDILAGADAALKSTHSDARTLLEQTVVQLIHRVREG